MNPPSATPTASDAEPSSATEAPHISGLADDAAPLQGLLERRSITKLTDPGPTDEQLDTILLAATTVPDHGNLRPWRFVVVTGEERAPFGDALLAAGLAGNPDLPEPARVKLHSKAFVAPTFVVIVSSPKPGNVARWEQEASAASAGYAMTLAAHLLGIGAIWKSAPMRTGSELAKLLALTSDELLMGWVNLGTATAEPRERRRPAELSEVASRLDGGHLRRWDT